jgi:hypothetical protein
MISYPDDEERAALNRLQDVIERELPGFVAVILLGRKSDGDLVMSQNVDDATAVAMLDMAADSRRVTPKLATVPGKH